MHKVPDPPHQSGCTGCGNDLRHGFKIGSRVVMIAPMTARLHGTISNFALDKSDVLIDGRDWTTPLSCHTKWLAAEETYEPAIQVFTTIDAAADAMSPAHKALVHAAALGDPGEQGEIEEPNLGLILMHGYGTKTIHRFDATGDLPRRMPASMSAKAWCGAEFLIADVYQGDKPLPKKWANWHVCIKCRLSGFTLAFGR